MSELPPGPPPLPPPVPEPVAHSESSGLEMLVPSKNPHALWSYYLGIFSLVPLFGIVMGILAIVLGVKALRLAKENPRIRGRTHAWVGIVCGGLFGLVSLVLVCAMVFAIADSNARGAR